MSDKILKAAGKLNARVKELEAQLAEAHTQIGKMMTEEDGHVCPSCGCPASWRSKNQNLEAERDELTKQIADEREITQEMVDKKLLKERDRLREALQEIVECADDYAHIVAKKALEETT